MELRPRTNSGGAGGGFACLEEARAEGQNSLRGFVSVPSLLRMNDVGLGLLRDGCHSSDLMLADILAGTLQLLAKLGVGPEKQHRLR